MQLSKHLSNFVLVRIYILPQQGYMPKVLIPVSPRTPWGQFFVPVLFRVAVEKMFVFVAFWVGGVAFCVLLCIFAD